MYQKEKEQYQINRFDTNTGAINRKKHLIGEHALGFVIVALRRRPFPMQLNLAKLLYFLNQCDFKILQDLECSYPVLHSQIFDWKHHLKQFERDGDEKPGKEKGDTPMN